MFHTNRLARRAPLLLIAGTLGGCALLRPEAPSLLSCKGPYFRGALGAEQINRRMYGDKPALDAQFLQWSRERPVPSTVALALTLDVRANGEVDYAGVACANVDDPAFLQQAEDWALKLRFDAAQAPSRISAYPLYFTVPAPKPNLNPNQPTSTP